MKDIYGHVVEFSRDQQGSRFIQHKLDSAGKEERERVFSEIKREAVLLMKDVFGNYVIQKFFDFGNQTHKTFFLEHMRGKIFELSTHVYACRVIQKVSCPHPSLSIASESLLTSGRLWNTTSSWNSKPASLAS